MVMEKWRDSWGREKEEGDWGGLGGGTGREREGSEKGEAGGWEREAEGKERGETEGREMEEVGGRMAGGERGEAGEAEEGGPHIARRHTSTVTNAFHTSPSDSSYWFPLTHK